VSDLEDVLSEAFIGGAAKSANKTEELIAEVIQLHLALIREWKHKEKRRKGKRRRKWREVEVEEEEEMMRRTSVLEKTL